MKGSKNSFISTKGAYFAIFRYLSIDLQKTYLFYNKMPKYYKIIEILFENLRTNVIMLRNKKPATQYPVLKDGK